jgi:hypothetical protein
MPPLKIGIFTFFSFFENWSSPLFPKIPHTKARRHKGGIQERKEKSEEDSKDGFLFLFSLFFLFSLSFVPLCLCVMYLIR